MRSPAGSKHQAGWTASLSPGRHIQKKQQVGRWICGASTGFHLLLNKQKLLQCYILHHSQVAKEWSLNPFLQITPEPQEPSPVTWLNQTVPFLPEHCRPVGTGVLCLSHSSGSSLFPLTLHLPMQIHRNKLFLFSCLQESLISARPLLPITPVTHHWRQEHRDCKKIIYIYIPNWIQFYVFEFRKNASHIHIKIHQENTRGKTLPTARNTQKSTVIATVTFSWGVYLIEETSLCTGESQILWLIFLCQLVWIKSVKLLL